MEMEECLWCGDSFEYGGTDFHINGFCSEECYSAHKYQRIKPKRAKYCKKFNNELRERVRLQFKNRCLLCGKTEVENSRSLSVHHVDHDKSAGCNNNKMLLIPLCDSCHAKVHKNKEFYKDHFSQIIKNKYESKCYLTKEEYETKKSLEVIPEIIRVDYPITYINKDHKFLYFNIIVSSSHLAFENNKLNQSV
jgi:ribosomal protein L24E